MEVGAWCSYRSYSVCWIWSLLCQSGSLYLDPEMSGKPHRLETVRAESTLPNPETRWNWIAINNHELNVIPRKRWAGFFFWLFLPLSWRGRMKRVRAEQAGAADRVPKTSVGWKAAVILHVNCSKRENDTVKKNLDPWDEVKGMCHFCVRRPVVFYWQIDLIHLVNLVQPISRTRSLRCWAKRCERSDQRGLRWRSG